MNVSQPSGVLDTGSTPSTAQPRARRWWMIRRVGFWRALLEFNLAHAGLSLLSYGTSMRDSFVWLAIVSVLSLLLYSTYAWRLAAGAGTVWRRLGRVLLWSGLAGLIQSGVQIGLLANLPAITFMGQSVKPAMLNLWNTLPFTMAYMMAFWLPLRTCVSLIVASRYQLRWRLTLSYVLVGLIVTISIPVALLIILGIAALFVLPSLPTLSATPQDAAAALIPLIQRNAPATELTPLLQGIINGETRLPSPTMMSTTLDEDSPSLQMQLLNVQRLTVLQPDNTVLASAGTDAYVAGSRLPDTEQVQISSLVAQAANGGCYEGAPTSGFQPDHAVCAVTDQDGHQHALLIAEASSFTAPSDSINGTQLLIWGSVGISLILGLTPFALLVILPVAGGGVGYLLAGRLTKRLERLTAAAGDIASGNLQRRVAIDSEDEVGRLANDFNTMAAKLAQREHALSETAQRAETLLRANKRLVADVSHELRTPLTTMRGYLEALQHEHGDKLPQRDLQVIDTELQRLTALINDLFTLARAEAQQLPLSIEPTDAHALASRLVETLTPLARREREIEVVAALPHSLPLVCADRARLEQVLLNLFQNALRYTPAGGIVALEAQATGDHVTITVADTGMGIAPDELIRVWERFYRSDRSRARETGGAGLGLALVKELVTAMGGTVDAQSELARGSRFSITLQVAEVTG